MTDNCQKLEADEGSMLLPLGGETFNVTAVHKTIKFPKQSYLIVTGYFSNPERSYTYLIGKDIYVRK